MALRAIRSPKGTECMLTVRYFGSKFRYSKLPISEYDDEYSIDINVYIFPPGTVRTCLTTNTTTLFESDTEQYGIDLEIL